MAHLLNTLQRLSNLSYGQFGLIASYRQQVVLLEEITKKCDGLLVGTAEKFLGQERDIIFISTVRSHGKAHNLRFIFDPKRSNTTISRARYGYFTLHSISAFQNDKNTKMGPISIPVPWSSCLGRARYCKRTDIGKHTWIYAKQMVHICPRLH